MGVERAGIPIQKKNRNAPFLQILNARDPALSINNHFGEQVRETSAAELPRARAVQVAVVDGFAVGWGAQAGGGGGG